jgi:hypothetical protein
MEATCTSETSLDLQRTTQRCIPEVKLFTTTAVRNLDDIDRKKFADVSEDWTPYFLA